VAGFARGLGGNRGGVLPHGRVVATFFARLKVSWETQGLPVLRVEAWHGLLVLTLLVTLAPLHIVEPLGLILGAAFMGVNFMLLACGLRWVIAPFATTGRIRAGIFLLVFKFVFLLVASWILLTRISPDGISFAVGVTCLVTAIFVDRFYDTQLCR